MSKTDLNKKILNNEKIELTDLEKENAISKEAYFRDLYRQIFIFNNTKDFVELCNMLVTGYYCMMDAYKDKPKAKGDMDYIVKFAFRDFFLLIFINMQDMFNTNDYLKELHKKVYFSDNYVDLKTFKELIEYCKAEIIKHETK